MTMTLSDQAAAAAQLVNHVIEGGDQRTTALLRSSVLADRESPEAEP